MLRRARDVVERKIERATGAECATRTFTTTTLRGPIDRLGKHSRAFGNGSHRIHVGGRCDAELESHLVAQVFVLRWPAHEDNSLNVVRTQTCFFDALSGGLNGLIDLGCNQVVIQTPADGDVEVNFFTSLVTYAQLILGKADDGFLALRQRNLCFFSGPRRNGAQRFVLWIGCQVLRQVEVVEQPWLHDVVEKNPVEIASAAHGNATMRKEVDTATDTLGDGDIQRAPTNVIHNKNAIVLALAHDAHHRSDRLLHQCDTPKARRVGGCHRGVFLHLVERGRHRDNGTGVAITPNLFGQVAEEGAQHLGGTFFRSHAEIDSGQLHRRARAHEPLEQHGSVVGILRCAVVGARADVLVTAPVNEDGRWRDVVLLRALVEMNLLSVVGADGTVGRAEVDTDVFHASTFLSITVPCLRSPFGPMMIGSSI